MAFNKNQFTIKESKDISLARYFISYSSNSNTKGNQQKSYQLLSLLKQQNNVLLEIDSELTTLPTTSETDIAIRSLLTDFTDMGMDYRYQKSEAKSSKSLFGIFNSNKTHTAHRILACISDKLWHDEEFQLIIPCHGVRYYICKENMDAKKLLEDLFCGKIMEDEMQELFPFVIYDCIDFGQMGIHTELTKAELQNRLTV